MTIWVLALILFGVVGALGRQVGGIRMGISLVGVLVALFVAGPLSPHVRTVLGAIGVKNPITAWSLAAPLAFLGVMLVFNSIAMATYIKISGFYKFRATDDVRMRWERIDTALGLSTGLLAAVVYLLAACAYVYHVGYFTKQVQSPTGNPLWLTLVNKLHDDMSASKFDRVAAGVGQASPVFFQTADAVGLIYHNPELQARLPEYPLFMSLAENGDFQNVFTNETFSVLLPAKTNISFILKDPVGRPIITHPETQRVATELDVPDLITFLQTGRSPLFAKEPIVGKWQVDLNSTVRQYAKSNPKATANELGRLRPIVRYYISDYTLTVTPDEKVYVKSRRDPVAFALLLNPGFRPTLMDTNQPIKTVLQGGWKKEGEKFQFTLQSAQGERTADVNFVENGKLATAVGANTLVFERLD